MKIFIKNGDDIPILKPAVVFAGNVKNRIKAILISVAGSRKNITIESVAHMAVFAALFSAFLWWSVGLRPMLAVSQTDIIRLNSESEILQDPSYDEEILWFARIIYSETKDVREQIYVAWVARNRVENEFRGDTYKEVALAPSQFSGLNSFDRNYAHNVNLDYNDDVAGWKTAIEVAKLVYDAPEVLRPFPETVMHFYSPRVVNAPKWAQGREAVRELKDHRGYVRFAFYDGVR